MRTEISLNGYWKFQPITTINGHTPPSTIPEKFDHRMIVPGSWTKGIANREFSKQLEGTPWEKWKLFDNYSNPSEWDLVDSAWYQRDFEIDEIKPEIEYQLHFGGILREAWIFVNGQQVAHSINGIMPLDCNITDAIQPGTNLLTVYVTDYRRNSDGKVYTPLGADQMMTQKGIWQDVSIITLPKLRADDITIRTSTRQNKLSLVIDLTNQSDQSNQSDLVLKFRVLDGATSVLEFSSPAFSLRSSENRSITVEVPWSDYKAWSHHAPHLYQLETELLSVSEGTPDGGRAPSSENNCQRRGGVPSAGLVHERSEGTPDGGRAPSSENNCQRRGGVPSAGLVHERSEGTPDGGRAPRPAALDLRRDRFGFREVWIEGHHIMLNGAPVHLSGDWSHRLSMESLTTAYFEKWFGMLKDCNMNYIRTHTFPHPSNMLDLADEQGMLISLEAGWHFGSDFALDEEEFWQGALQHVRDIIKRDKNHPSIILWSVGNEVRWSGNQPAIIKNVPRLRKLYEELDPTRIPYHDGDSSLWDERTQPLISRHYGLECTGEGWWDKKQPLHVGELGKWHYGQPIDNCIWGNDSVFASFRECHKAIAQECADQIEQARANEVCCMFPWNLSGLDNFRPETSEKTFKIEDPATPGIKVTRSAPYGSEFAWWKNDSKGYLPGVGFNIIRDSLRPIAVIVREKQKHHFSDQTLSHTITVVNDSASPIDAELYVTIGEKAPVWQATRKLELQPGHATKFELAIPLTECPAETDISIISKLSQASEVLDEHQRTICVTPAESRQHAWELPPLALLDDGSLAEILQAHGIHPRQIKDLSELDANQTQLLLMGAHTVIAGSQQNKQLQAYLNNGGRAIVLEQSTSIMPGIQIDLKPVERCHFRGNPNGLLTGFQKDDFAYWGNDPYGKSDSESWVSINPFRKDALPGGQALLHSGAGDFGSDGLYWSPLIESRTGNGLLIASQLRIAEKAATHPIAHRLLQRYLKYAAEWTPAATQKIATNDVAASTALQALGLQTDTSITDSSILWRTADSLDQQTAQALAENVSKGATCIITELTPATAALLAKAFNTPITVKAAARQQYLLTRTSEHPLLYGISNQETCWLQKMQYSKPERKNRPITAWMLRCEAATELLSGERESCWHEFYLDGACSERLRMPVVTALLGSGPQPADSGLLEIRHGLGRLILAQMPLPLDSDHDVARCFWTQFANNLSATFCGSLLDGDCIQLSSVRSQGQPDEFGYIGDPDEATLIEILRTAHPTEFRIHNHALVYGFNWQVMLADDGTFRLPENHNHRRIALAFQINAGRPRMIRYAEDGLPDPTEQTLCDLHGTGKVTPFINGRQFDTITLGSEQHGVIPDIDLNMDWNTIVLIWEPQDGQTLSISWRDRQRRPEVEFAFMFKNTKFLSGAVHQ